MYYHCRPLKYVVYGKILPPPLEAIDDIFFLNAYDWLGKYCGYSPQIWLSRSTSQITGYKNFYNKNLKQGEDILFGFEDIKGFFLDYSVWNLILTIVGDYKLEKDQKDQFKNFIEFCEKDQDKESKEWLMKWQNCNRDYETFINKYLFVKNDQVVVPSLNLKSAKKIFCQNEKQKKKLRKMGFIEDRIEIKKC
jgi:hypothetical protein